MNFVALKMLTGDRIKYLGIVIGLTFASLLITQQLSIFVGLMTRTYSVITNISDPDIWVMDEQVQNIDDVRPISDDRLYRVRGVPGVAWAVPLFKGQIRAKLPDGQYQICTILGLDDQSLVGGPPQLLYGARIADLRMADAVFIDEPNAREKLGNVQTGDILELNDHRARIVGLCKMKQAFVTMPLIYTTYSRARDWVPGERNELSFVLVKAKPGVAPADLAQQIRAQTGLGAYTSEAFAQKTLWYYIAHTGIPINFGTTVLLGFIVGVAIAGQTFYQFAHDNMRYFGTLKAMGASNFMLIRMILLQAALAGTLGYGIGIGCTCLFKLVVGGLLTPESQRVMIIYWQILAIGAGSVMFIVLASSLLALIKVVRLEPAIVFK